MNNEYEQIRNQAYFICCPMCDENVCVGKDKCSEVTRFVDNFVRSNESCCKDGE